jgi:alcohol dehydrogenase class IV
MKESLRTYISMQTPSRLYFGNGALESIKDIIIRRNGPSVLLFADPHLRKSGLTGLIESCLDSTGTHYEVIDKLAIEPSAADMENTLSLVQNKNAGLIVAMGGGSVMDTAKLASVLLGAPYSLKDLLEDPSQARKRFPQVMIPTTCGTGSEATCNAIVSIPEENVKKGIVNPLMIPDEVILDVSMVRSLPKPIIAATGIDALAHCVECWTSKKATTLSDLYAGEGARIIFRNIEDAYALGDERALQNMLLGAYYGGAAIAGSGTTAVHALSYPLGGRYHIAHGVSNAIMFSPVMLFNRDSCQERLAALCDHVYPQKSLLNESARAGFIIGRIAEIVRNTEIPLSLNRFGITENDIEQLALAGSQQKRLLANNMKEMTLDDIRSIYRNLIRGEGEHD